MACTTCPKQKKILAYTIAFLVAFVGFSMLFAPAKQPLPHATSTSLADK